MDLSRWLVRRAGLARVSMGSAILGLAAAGLVDLPGPSLLVALAVVLAALAAATAWQHSSTSVRESDRVLVAPRAAAPGGRGAVRIDLTRELTRQRWVWTPAGLSAACIPILAVLAFGLAGASIGALRTAELRAWPPESLGRAVTVRVTVVTLTSRDDQAFAQLEDGSFRGRTVLLSVPRQEGRQEGGRVQLTEGLRFLVRGRFRSPEPPTEEGFDQGAYLRRKGAGAILEARELTPTGSRGGLSGRIDSLRREARGHLSADLDTRFSGLLRGVILGEQAKLDESDMQAFRASGTAHILSVSGLHVASLASLVLIGGAAAQLPRNAVTVLAGLLATLFVPLTGASPPVLRATAVFLLFLLSDSVGRGRDRYQVLLLAAAAVLSRNPYAVTDPGFQLSFAAAASMLMLTGRFEAGLRFLPQALRQGLAVSLAATLGTAPVSLFTFGQVSLSGVGANLLVVPLLPPLMALGLGSVAAGFASHSLAGLLNQLSSILLAWLCLVAHAFGRFPLLEEAHVWGALAVAAGVILALPLSSGLLQRPPPFELRSRLLYRTYVTLHRRRGIGRRRRLVLALLVPLLLGAVGLGTGKAAGGLVEAGQIWARGRDWPSAVELRVLDVGQGSAALLRTPGRRSVLFDAGPAGGGLGRQLRSLGVRRLDVVVFSHPHADHFAGLLQALETVKVERFIDAVELEAEKRDSPAPGRPGESGAGGSTSQAEREANAYRDLRRALSDQGATWVQGRDGLALHLDGVTVELRAPPEPVVLPGGQELNDSSLIALVRSGATAILLPGDAEAQVLARYRLAPVTALVVSHHGSKGSVTRSFLNRLSPELAIISVGRDNSFGHPHGEVTNMLQQAKVPVMRTDDQGWVALRLGSWGLAAEAENPFEVLGVAAAGPARVSGPGVAGLAGAGGR